MVRRFAAASAAETLLPHTHAQNSLPVSEFRVGCHNSQMERFWTAGHSCSPRHDQHTENGDAEQTVRSGSDRCAMLLSAPRGFIAANDTATLRVGCSCNQTLTSTLAARILRAVVTRWLRDAGP